MRVGEEARFTDPTPACPHPEYWHSTDNDSTEIEVSELAGAFVRALQPYLVIETGSAFGQTAEQIGLALQANGHGSCVTFEVEPSRVTYTRQRVAGMPVHVRDVPSLDGIAAMIDAYRGERVVGFAWLDSTLELRAVELDMIRPLLTPGAIVGVHDAGDPRAGKHGAFSEHMAHTAHRLGYSRVSLPTPRGVSFLGWRY